MTGPTLPAITVLIPTRAASQRRSLLRRAVDSVLRQQDVAVRAVIIVNGASREALEPSLLSDQRVGVVTRAHADLPAAYREGVRAIGTPFFGTLDDDDELLPGALKVRHAALERQPERLVTVTNGIRRDGGVETLHVPDARQIEKDPLRALLRRNWLLPGSWLCRTTAETRALFDGMPRFLECTYLGLRFSMLGMIWIDEPTVIHHVGTPLAESRSLAYVEGQAEALRKILELDLPPDARRTLRPRIAAAHHRAANIALEAGAVRDAWRWHLATLRERSGWRYLPFMRHLLRASLRSRT